jgi:hypothetical protein
MPSRSAFYTLRPSSVRPVSKFLCRLKKGYPTDRKEYDATIRVQDHEMDREKKKVAFKQSTTPINHSRYVFYKVNTIRNQNPLMSLLTEKDPLDDGTPHPKKHATTSLSRLLVLCGDALEGDDEVLEGTLLGVLLGGLAVHKVVECNGVLEEVIDTTEDAEDTEGEDPDTDNSDDGGLMVHATLEPTEETEEGSKGIDDEDSAGKLPRGEGRPEGTVGTGDEDEPVLSEGDLQEEDLVTVTEVLDDTTLIDTVAVVASNQESGEGDPGTDGKDNTEEDGHTPQLGEVPLDGRLGVGGVIVGNGQGSDIGENGDEDDQVQVERLVEDGNPETQEDLEMERQGDTVDDVGVHAVENLARSLESVDDGGKTRGKEDDIGSGTSSIGSTLDGDTGIGLLEGRSIVDTITSHGNEVATLLENFDDVVLVLGEDLSETIGSLNEIVHLRSGHVSTSGKTKLLSVVDVGTEAELTRSLTSDTDGITSQHLDGKTKVLGLVDGLRGIVTRRIRARHDTENLPMALTALAGNTKGTETTGSELGDLVLVVVENILGDGVVFLDGTENEERSSLNTDNALALRGLDDGGDLLGDGIEGVELKDLVAGENVLGAGVELERLEESLVNGIKTLLLARGSETASQHEIIGLNTSDSVGLGQRELVLGEGTGLVGAENLDTSKGLDGRELLDDSLLLGEVGSTDSHGGGNDSGETDGDTDDGDGEGELQDVDDAVGPVEGGNPDDEEGDDNEDEQNRTNAVQDLGEMTGTGRGARDESGSATDESVVTGGSDDHEGLTTLDRGRGVHGVTLVLVDSKGFTSDGGLINLEEGILGDNATVGGDNGTLLDLEDITGNDLRSLDLEETAITKNNSLERKSLLELSDDGTGLELLDETNTGVEEQETTDDTEINPILETGSENGSSLHDELNRADEEHEEFQDHVLLLFLHLIETVFPSPLVDFGGSETSAGVGLEKVLGDGASGSSGSDLLLSEILLSILRLEVVDEGVDILDVLIFVLDGGRLLLRVSGLFGLKYSGRNIGPDLGCTVPGGVGSGGRH